LFDRPEAEEGFLAAGTKTNMIAYSHRLGDVLIRTESDVHLPHVQLAPFDRFLADNGKADAVQRIRQLDLSSQTMPPLDSSECQRLGQTVEFPERWLKNPVFLSPPVREALRRGLDQPQLTQVALAWNRTLIRNYAHNKFDLFYPSGKKKEFSDPVFIAGFRNLISYALPNFSAVLIHGGGVVRRNRALIFLASDGGGKSTVIRQLASGSVLNDDQLILRRDGDGISVHSTPFGTTGGGPLQAKLGAIFLLEKGSRFELIPVKPREIVQFIWNEHRSFWAILPKSLRLHIFEILIQAGRQAVVFRMRFPRDFVDWDTLDSVLER
jgi:hypothetical protein